MFEIVTFSSSLVSVDKITRKSLAVTGAQPRIISLSSDETLLLVLLKDSTSEKSQLLSYELDHFFSVS